MSSKDGSSIPINYQKNMKKLINLSKNTLLTDKSFTKSIYIYNL